MKRDNNERAKLYDREDGATLRKYRTIEDPKRQRTQNT